MNNPEKDEINEGYDLKKWAKQTKIGRRIFIWNFFLTEKNIPGWKLIKEIPKQIQDDKKIHTYMWKKGVGKGNELIRVDIVESISWRRIHEILLKQLVGDYQAPQLLKATSGGIRIGDIAFIGFGEIVQSMVFTRANMLVRIHSVGRKVVSIADVAGKVDDLFVSKRRLSDEVVVPEICSFSSIKRVVKIGEPVALNISARDLLDRPLWYKLIVDQGELFIKDEKMYFSSETSGRPVISLFAINENDFVSSAKLEIEVR